jgi:acetyl-CoA acyltransferase
MAEKRDPQRDPVVVAAVRTPVGKAKRGSLATVRPDELAALTLKEVLARADHFDPALVDDVIIGCAMPEGEQGLNMARLAALRAGFPPSVPAETINRFCSSGLQSIAHAAYAIMAGQLEIAIAGGAESMSMVPMIGFNFSPNGQLALEYPQAYLSMGLTAENVAEKYDISRADQDVFAYRSHEKAVRAVETGLFDDQIVPVEVDFDAVSDGGRLEHTTFTFRRDEGPRADTSLEAMTRLKPVFRDGGTVTAGNSSQMSDGAAAALVMSRARAETLGLQPLVRFLSFGVGGVPPEIMGIGPVEAVPKALAMAGLTLDEIDIIELNEAFAAQAVAVIRLLEMDLEKVNVNGGAIALGHPLGGTGAKLTTQIIHEMKRRNARFGMVTMCIGGGMGAAGIFENLN